MTLQMCSGNQELSSPYHNSKSLNILLVTCDLPSHPYAIAKLAQVLSSAGHKVTTAAPAGSALERVKHETCGLNIDCIQCGTLPDIPPMNFRPVVDPHSWETLFAALRNPLPVAEACNVMVDSQQDMYEEVKKIITKGDYDVIVPIHSVAQTVCDAVESLNSKVPVVIFSSTPYDPGMYLGDIEAWRATKSFISLPHVSTYSSKPILGFSRLIELFWQLLDTWLSSRAWARSAIANNKRRAARGLPPIDDGFRGYLQKYKVITVGGVSPFFDASAPIATNVTVLGALDTQRHVEREITGELKQWLDDAENGIIYTGFGTGTLLSDKEASAVTGDVIHSLSDQLSSPRVLFALRSSEQKRLKKVIDAAVGQEPDSVSDTHMEYMNGRLRIQADVPQAALLLSKKVRLFISHMGFGGFTESTRGGVPFIAYPSGCDQYYNTQRAVEAGIAWQAPYGLDGLGELVGLALRDITLTKRAQKASKDLQQVHGEEIAVRAIEDAVRN